MNENEKYPEGHFVGIWMTIGITFGVGIGIPIGFAIGIPGLFGIGLSIGLATGVAVGSSIEARYKKEGKIRPLTEAEKKTKWIGVVIGTVLLAIGIITFLFFVLKF